MDVDNDDPGDRGDGSDDSEYAIPVPAIDVLLTEVDQTIRHVMKGRAGRGGQNRILAARLMLERLGAIQEQKLAQGEKTGVVVKLVDKQAAHDELMRRMRERQAKGHL